MPYNVMSKQSTNKYNSSRTITISPHTHTISCTHIHLHSTHTHPILTHPPLHTPPCTGTLTGTTHTHTPTPTHIMLRKVLAFAKGAVKKSNGKLRKVQAFNERAVKKCWQACVCVYIYIYICVCVYLSSAQTFLVSCADQNIEPSCYIYKFYLWGEGGGRYQLLVTSYFSLFEYIYTFRN